MPDTNQNLDWFQSSTNDLLYNLAHLSPNQFFQYPLAEVLEHPRPSTSKMLPYGMSGADYSVHRSTESVDDDGGSTSSTTEASQAKVVEEVW